MDGIKKCACGLVRVSTEEQARGGYGLTFQEEDIKRFCDRNALDLLHIFRDEGFSGSTSDRPGFKEMMEWARGKRFEVLVVWKLDRLFRDTRLTLQTVDELAALNIDFRSVQETFTHDSNGRFLLTIFAAGAEKERKDINLRMYSGRIAAAKRGVLVNGVSNPAFGYAYDKAVKRLVILEEEAAVIRHIYHWFVEEKLTIYKIQQRLNDMRVPTKYDRQGWRKRSGTSGWWQKRTIGRILENEIYTGQLILRKYKSPFHSQKESNLRPTEEWITIETPRIVSDELFGKARTQLVTNTRNSPRNTKNLYLLGKLLVCGIDNKKMVAVTMPSGKNHSDVRYYYCNGANKSNSPVLCQSGYVREDRIAPPVWDKLIELLVNPSVVLPELARYQEEKTMVADAQARKRTAEVQLNNTKQQLRRLAEVYITGAVDKVFYESEVRRLRDQADGLSRQLKQCEALAVSAERIIGSETAIQALYTQYRDRLENASDEVKREILHEFINSVVIRGDDLEIEVHLPSGNAIAEQPLSRLSRNIDIPVLFLKAKMLSS
jgi:site-specific DNA recombinase